MDHQDHVNLLRPAGLQPGGTWADFGAGSGAFTLALRELIGPESEIYAIDKNRPSLDELGSAFQKRFNFANQKGGLHLLHADFANPLPLPVLDGIVMANALHFYKNKCNLLENLAAYLKPGGIFLLVEYNVDSGNLWVPYPLSFQTFADLAPSAGFARPRLLATVPSRFLRQIYSAAARKQE